MFSKLITLILVFLPKERVHYPLKFKEDRLAKHSVNEAILYPAHNSACICKSGRSCFIYTPQYIGTRAYKTHLPEASSYTKRSPL